MSKTSPNKEQGIEFLRVSSVHSAQVRVTYHQVILAATMVAAVSSAVAHVQRWNAEPHSNAKVSTIDHRERLGNTRAHLCCCIVKDTITGLAASGFPCGAHPVLLLEFQLPCLRLVVTTVSERV